MVYFNIVITYLLIVLAEVSTSNKKVDSNRNCKKGPPFCNRWCIYSTLSGCCVKTKFVCCSYREKPSTCPKYDSICRGRYSYHVTNHYVCNYDFNCPMGYKCCEDRCFLHKVCKLIVNNRLTTSTTDVPTTSKFITNAMPITTTETMLSTTSTVLTAATGTNTYPSTTEYAEIESSTNNEDVTTLRNTEGSGIGEIIEPQAELIEGFFDDEDLNHR